MRHTIGPVAAIAFAVGALLAAERGGMGVLPDSVTYLEGARALAQGDGYATRTDRQPQPITHFPPLYPAALAAASVVREAPLAAARDLSVLLRVGLLLVVWAGMRRVARTGWLATTVAMSLVALSPELTVESATVASEPLFWTLSVAGLLFVAEFLALPRRALLAPAAVLHAAAVLTRYVGLSLIGVVAALLLLRRGRPWRHKLGDVVWYAGSAAVPVLLWLQRNRGVGSSATNRTIALHPPTPQNWRDAAATVSRWLSPPAVPPVMGATFVLVAAAAILALAWRHERTADAGESEARRLVVARVFLAGSFAYLAFVAVSRLLADAMIPFDGRLFSPALLYLLIGVVAAFDSSLLLSTRAQRAATVLAGIVAALMARHLLDVIREPDVRLGYAGPRFAHIAAEVAGLQRSASYSNDPEFLRFSFGSSARPLPFRYDPWTNRTNPDFGERLRSLCGELAASGHTVFYMNKGVHSFRWYPSIDELTSLGALRPRASGSNWTVLEPAGCSR